MQTERDCVLGLGACIIALSMGVIAPPTKAEAADLRVGFAQVDITPPDGYRMAGYFYERANTGIRDPLRAKAIVFRQRDQAAALVFCDLIGLDRAETDQARLEAGKIARIPPGQIAITATHSHTGPLFSGVLRDFWHARALADHGRDEREPINYQANLVAKLVEVIEAADQDARPMQVAAGHAKEPTLSFSRRFFMKDGTVVFNPGRHNPAIVQEAGPIDPDVSLLAFREVEGGPLRAAFTVFALHLDTVGGAEYAADYPRPFERALRERFGSEFQSIFGTGTCGDINHLDVRAVSVRSTEQIGNRLAETVAEALPTLKPISDPGLAVAQRTITVPVRRPSADAIPQARALLPKVGSPELPFLDAVRAVTTVDLADNFPAGTADLEVQVIRLGSDTAIVLLPGEVFVGLGLAIKQRSPFANTLVVELANDSPAYIPTRQAFGEGSYEVVNSRIAPGGGEAMVEAAVALLHTLAP